jgi:hypothetical protein
VSRKNPLARLLLSPPPVSSLATLPWAGSHEFPSRRRTRRDQQLWREQRYQQGETGWTGAVAGFGLAALVPMRSRPNIMAFELDFYILPSWSSISFRQPLSLHRYSGWCMEAAMTTDRPDQAPMPLFQSPARSGLFGCSCPISLPIIYFLHMSTFRINTLLVTRFAKWSICSFYECNSSINWTFSWFVPGLSLHGY